MITYEGLCKKVGFDIKSYKIKIDHERDNEVNPFSCLTIEELDFMVDYLIKEKKRNNEQL